MKPTRSTVLFAGTSLGAILGGWLGYGEAGSLAPALQTAAGGAFIAVLLITAALVIYDLVAKFRARKSDLSD